MNRPMHSNVIMGDFNDTREKTVAGETTLGNDRVDTRNDRKNLLTLSKVIHLRL